MQNIKSQLDSVDQSQKYGILSSKFNSDQTILHKAASDGQRKLIEYLLNSVPPVIRQLLLIELDGKGQTPLHCAVQSNVAESVSCLLESLSFGDRERLLMIKDLNGETALHQACRQDSESLIQLLLKDEKSRYAQLEIQNKFGETALHISSSATLEIILHSIPRYEIFDLLRKQNLEGSTVLHIIVEEGNFSAVDYLLSVLTPCETALIVRLHRNDGKTVLDIAKANSNTEIITKIEQAEEGSNRMCKFFFYQINNSSYLPEKLLLNM